MKVLDITVNIVLLCAAVVLLGSKGYDRFVIDQKRVAPITVLNKRYINNRFALPSDAKLGQSATVIMFVSKGCQFCEASMPFYQQLAKMLAASAPHFRMLALFPEQRETIEEGVEFFARNDVTIDQVSTSKFADYGITGTPTLFLLDSAGRVRGIWIGSMAPDRQKELLLKISELCRECKTV